MLFLKQRPSSQVMYTSIQKNDSGNSEAVVGIEWTGMNTGGKQQLDYEQARQLTAQYDPNSPEEKLLRKLDWRLVVS